MKTQRFQIGTIPAVLYGEPAKQGYVFLHGQMGRKEEAEAFAQVVCPILDMEGLILTMMGWAGVTEEHLQAQGEIATSFGQTLSWKYLCWVREHPVHNWTCPIRILYGSRDNMTSRRTIDEFVRRHDAGLTVMEGGEHWFHTPEQLAAVRRWEMQEA